MDKCILKIKAEVTKIKKSMHLPANAIADTDLLYRCTRCLRGMWLVNFHPCRDKPKNSSCRLVGRMFGGVFGSYAERFWLRCSPAGSSIGLSLSTAPQLCLHGSEPLGY